MVLFSISQRLLARFLLRSQILAPKSKKYIRIPSNKNSPCTLRYSGEQMGGLNVNLKVCTLTSSCSLGWSNTLKRAQMESNDPHWHELKFYLNSLKILIFCLFCFEIYVQLKNCFLPFLNLWSSVFEKRKYMTMSCSETIVEDEFKTPWQ